MCSKALLLIKHVQIFLAFWLAWAKSTEKWKNHNQNHNQKKGYTTSFKSFHFVRYKHPSPEMCSVSWAAAIRTSNWSFWSFVLYF